MHPEGWRTTLPDALDIVDEASTGIVLWTDRPGAARAPSSALVAWSSERAAFRTLEFLTANIRNHHTRRAYQAAAKRFLVWCCAKRLTLAELRSPDVAEYIEELSLRLAPLSVKQHLAALKHWFDWLVTGHVLESNPAQAVRGPRYSQETGKTPVLEKDEARALLASIEPSAVIGARDRALIAVMLFSYARVGAVLRMKVRDYRGVGTPRASFLLHEKNGKEHVVPAHHLACEYLDAYITLAGIADQPDAPLWQNAPGHGGTLSGGALSGRGALGMVKRRCRNAGLAAEICNHSFRATGITLHQDAGGDLEAARQIAGHANIKTTQLYNRSGDRKRRAEVERVQL